MSRDIAIVGMACQFPKAPALAAYWDNIVQARVCYEEIGNERWNHALFYHPSPRETDKTYARKVAHLDDVWSFAGEHYQVPPLRAKVMDPQHRLLLDTVRVALESAGLERSLPRAQVGTFIGASISEHRDILLTRLRGPQLFDGAYGRGLQLDAAAQAATLEALIPGRAFTIPGNLLNMTAATVSQWFDFGGPSYTICSACSSSLVAAHDAIVHLRAGLCDAAIAGGVYLNLTPDTLVGMSRIGSLSRSDRCRPFDAEADGFVLGEGVGVVVLKRLDDAVRDGDGIFAVIRGAGISNDGRTEGPMVPRRDRQILALERAYGDCGISPETVGLIEAQGLAAPVSDRVEVEALEAFFCRDGRRPDCRLSSVKANIGHTMSAAGVAGLIRAALALSEETLPPQAGFAAAHPDLELAAHGFHVSTAARPWIAGGPPRRAGVNCFGFGGTNCHLVLEEAPRARATRLAAAHPVTVLPTERYCCVTPVTPSPKLPTQLAGDQPREEPAMSDRPPDALVALFREQTALLASHAEIIRKQTEALRPGAALRPAPSPSPSPSDDLAGRVLDAIGAVNTFPRASITNESRLVEDLGFDSLMAEELWELLHKALPGLDPLPKAVFTAQLTFGELVRRLSGGRAQPGPVVAPALPVPPAPAAEPDPSSYRVEAFAEYRAMEDRFEFVKSLGIELPYFNVHERVVNDTTLVAGRELINFSCYNYLGLSGDPAVTRAVITAVERYGTSVSASRVASGEKPLHQELERGLADFLGCEDAIVMVGGYSTNVSVISQLFGPGDLVLHDALAHDSIITGAKHSGAQRLAFPHNDWAALDRLLTEMRPRVKRVLIAIEGVYSMDGDIPALDRFIEIKRRHRCFLYVDEAHSLGILGKTGRGVGELFGVDRADVDMWMGTLSKSLASCGGYIAGSRALIKFLKYNAAGFVFSVGLSPPDAAAALAALRELEARPELVQTLYRRSSLFESLCRERGIRTGAQPGSAVVPCIVGNSWECLRLSDALARRGINVHPIIYPAVEEHLARLRFVVSARHSEAQIRTTIDVLAEEIARLVPGGAQKSASG